MTGVTTDSAAVKVTQTAKNGDPFAGDAYWSDPTQGPVAAGTPQPAVDSFATLPDSGSSAPPTAKVGDTVLITGKHLWQTTSVSLAGVKVKNFTVLGSEVVQFAIEAGAKSGAVSVTTVGGTSLGGKLTIVKGKNLPAVTSVNKTSGGPGTALDITGTAIGSVTSVTLGKTALSFRPVVDNHVIATVPAGLKAGTYSIKLTTTAGTVSAGTFSYDTAPVAPTVSGFVAVYTQGGPNYNQSEAAPGQLIVVFGTDLGATTSISLGGIQIKSWAVYNPDTIGFILPSNTAIGTSAPLVITTPGGSAASTNLTVVAPK